MNDSVASECRKHVFGAQFTNTSFFIFIIKRSHMRTIKCCRFYFLGEVDNYCQKKHIAVAAKNRKWYYILQTVHIYSNLSNTLKTGFCQFSPVSGSQYPNFVYPNSFLGQGKATTKKINLISPAVIEKFNQRQLWKF